MDWPEIMTPDQVAEYLQIHVETARRYMRIGKIPKAFQLGREWRLRRVDLEAYVAALADGAATAAGDDDA